MATDAPTHTEIELYIQLDALWHIASYALRVASNADDLLPLLNLDFLSLGATTTSEPSEGVSLDDLFEKVVPCSREDSDQAAFVRARSALLVARLIRSIDPDELSAEADRMEGHAATQLAKISSRALETLVVV